MKQMSLTQWLKWIVGMDYQAVPVPVRALNGKQRLSFEPLADRRLPSVTPLFFNMDFGNASTTREEFNSDEGFAPRGFGFSFGFGPMGGMGRGMGMMFSFCPMHTHFGGSPWAPPVEEEVATDATHFDVKLLSDTYSGETTKIAVVALDEFNQPVPGYTGTIHFTSTDPSAVLPDDYTFTAADRGVRVFEITAANVGALTITVTEATTDETTDDITEPVEDPTDEVVSDPTDVVEEPVVDDVSDDTTEDVVDDTTEEVLEEPTDDVTEEVVDDTTITTDDISKIDETATDEVKDDTTTEDIVDEVIDDSTDITDITDDTTDEVVDDPTEEHTDDHDHSTDDVVDDTTDEVIDETTEEPTDDVVDDTTDEVVDDVTDVVEEPTDEVVDDTTEDVVDEVITEPTDEVVDDVIDDTTEEPTDDTTDDVIDDTTDEVVEDVAPATGMITLNVTAAPVATHFEIRAFYNVLADQPTRFQIVALDATNRPVTNYNGTIHVSSTDSTATLPADFTFTDADRGTHVFVGEFDTTGTQTLSVSDATDDSLTGAVALTVVDRSTALWDLPSMGFWGPRRLGRGV